MAENFEQLQRRRNAKKVKLSSDKKDTVGDLWHTLVNFTDLPAWQQDNSHIHTGYRKASYSYSRSFATMFHWHNESVNIWTHLCPALLSFPAGAWLYSVLKPRYDRATMADVYAMSCFFIGAAFCLGMSAVFHTLSNHSSKVAKFWNQLDYVGIAILIAGSFVPSVFYGFWCHPKLQIIYWTMISTLGLGCTAASLLSKFRTPAWRPFRAAMFVGMGLSAIFPVLHGLYLYESSHFRQQMGFFWLSLQGVLYITGAFLYAIRYPESAYPGRFDTLGASHQIFHVCVVLAAISHLIGLLKAFDYRHGFPGAYCV